MGASGGVGREYHTRQTHYLCKPVTYEDTTVVLGVIPVGGVIINAGVVIATAFNSGTSNVLDIGVQTTDTDDFATDLDLTTAGKLAADELATANNLYSGSVEQTIVAIHAPTGTAASAGLCFPFVEYVIPDPAS